MTPPRFTVGLRMEWPIGPPDPNPTRLVVTKVDREAKSVTLSIEQEGQGMTHECPITIQGMSPADYAGQWGSETKDGALLYNYSSERQVKDPAYLWSLWGAIDRILDDIALGSKGYEPQDEGCLLVLQAWVKHEHDEGGGKA